MFLGIDLGSRSVKVVLMDGEGNLQRQKFDTMEFYRKYGEKEEDRLVIDVSVLAVPPAGAVTATGYGRQAVGVKGARAIPEVMAHVKGAVYLTGLKDFTLLDLGGQDSKVALVRGGRVVDFTANDKCAASTGRYLENMAAALNISLEELGSHRRDPAELTSTCAVFGESELIGKIVEGCSIPSLAAGVNYSIFKRILPMLNRLPSAVIVFTGGVAYNRSLREIIGEETGARLVVPEGPEYAGAVGCCVDAAGIL
ncbi:MAG: 2-hydroxyglutaryl-CoA dehydratase [Pelotomaculum sp.]|uniref:Activator of 2-hydroxyglutaryl-CoA dehydratase n=1 Tax=Pelotomaculum thermopropionicum (strain DSM 13744 / JCM 10971 / SI) TaxID=370438 RepID=A5D464_PELTS|nr:2-hydroxyglutaryl-CoA dehydratase [Pelotomaculum sp.]BAF58970.1 activator of 2-hydroxyglutaryl-CoA dehydratase [Pelotomaculum thermopropionicum SI]